jgi:hypothetical protein
MEQSANNILMLKTLVDSIKPIWQALAAPRTEQLQLIREVCKRGSISTSQSNTTFSFAIRKTIWESTI